MVFEFWKDNGKSYIKANIENESEKKGYRAEGPYPKIEMVNNIVEFNYEVKSIHPDILALLCMVCFYPYCKGDVKFPKPVSFNFASAFGDNNNSLKQKEFIDGTYIETNTINIMNIDTELKPYKGKKISVSYGGGMDSTALYSLFPEAIFIHEQSKLPNGSIVYDKSIDNIDFINNQGGQGISFYNTSRRCISSPSGWSTWTACAANALLIATDYEIGYIFTGSVLGSVFLCNGSKYFPSDERKNKWVETFKKIGIPLVQVTGGLSEISNAKILMETNLLELPIWCNLKNGGNCHSCWKCFRRDTILNYIGYKNYSSEYWENYKSDNILNNLKKKPLYFGHIFKETLKSIKVEWINNICDDIPETHQFVNTLHEPSLKLIPEELREMVKNRILNFIPIGTNVDYVKKWKQ